MLSVFSVLSDSKESINMAFGFRFSKFFISVNKSSDGRRGPP